MLHHMSSGGIVDTVEYHPFAWPYEGLNPNLVGRSDWFRYLSEPGLV